MRNLQKLLALVLALVMSLALVTVAGAKDYTDVADNDAHIEAIDVMSALGIINGYTDGSFRPEGTLTRAEGAKIVTYMLLGDAADKLPKDITSFSDVPAGKWFAAPIAYLKGEGIVNGRSATVFAPNDPLTGYEFAKMVMVAAGIEGEFTGRSWKLNVASALSKNDLLTNVNPTSAPINRADAAQLGLNGLNYSSEEDTNKVVYTIEEDTSYASASAALKAITGTSYDTYAEAYDNATKADANALSSNYVVINQKKSVIKTDSLGDRIFGMKSVTSVDDFGRPSTSYTSTKKGYTDLDLVAPNEPDYVLYDKVTEKDLYNTVGGAVATDPYNKATGKGYDWTVYEDGTSSTPGAPKKTGNTANDEYADSGIGDVIEVYINEEDHAVTVVNVRTYVATVAKVNPADGADKRSISLSKESGVTFETEDFAKDDVVLYTKADTAHNATPNKIESVALAKSVTGTLTKVATKGTDTTYTVDDVDYVVNHTGDGTAMGTKIGKSVTFYVDARNNIVADGTAAATEKNYIYVLGNAGSVANPDYLASNGNNYTVEVYGVTADGEVQTLTAETSTTVAANAWAGKAYTYEVNSNGKVKVDVANALPTNGGNTITTNTPTVSGTKLNSDTVFVFVETKSATDKTVKDVVVKTGVANIGSTIAANKAYIAAEKGVAKVVFVADAYVDSAADTGNMVYVDKDSEKKTTIWENNASKEAYTYDAWTNEGEKITVTYTGTASDRPGAASGANEHNKVYKYNEDLTLGAAVASSEVKSGLLTAIDGSNVNIAGTDYLLDADAAFTKDENDLTVGQEVYAVVDKTDNKIVKALWVTKDTEAAKVTISAGGATNWELPASVSAVKMTGYKQTITFTVSCKNAIIEDGKTYIFTVSGDTNVTGTPTLTVAGNGTKTATATLTAEIKADGTLTVSADAKKQSDPVDLSLLDDTALTAQKTTAQSLTLKADSGKYFPDGDYKLYKQGDMGSELATAQASSGTTAQLQFTSMDLSGATGIVITFTASGEAESEPVALDVTLND